MKGITIMISAFLLLVLFIKLYENFYKGGLELREKQYHIELLTSEGGIPTIILQESNSLDFIADSILYYHTSCDITKDELRALAYLTKYYTITLYTE